MITARAFAGKHYAVYGLARSGLATVAALLASGAKVTAWDQREEARNSLLPPGGRWREAPEGEQPSQPPFVSAGALPPPPEGEERLVITDLDSADLSLFDSLVVTPGLPLNRHPIATRARDAGVEIIGDIELFARARSELPPHQVVGITGTNGKSTTTALVHHILETAGVPSTMGGNIGLPILAQDPLPEGGVYVLELSSYQIDLTLSLDCDVAVLLNITPDHLDRYDSFEAYAASKARLFEMQSSEHVGVFVLEDDECRRIMNDFCNAERPTKFLGHLPISRFGVASLALLEPGSFEPSTWPALQGPHNTQNAAAAIDVAVGFGLTYEEIGQALRTFAGLPHRMERIREKDGVIFVNDSKATNAEAAAPALAAFPNVRWIVGGQAKSDSLGDTAAQLGHVVKAYTIGEAGPMFARLLRDQAVPVEECETLEIATKRAAKDSLPGDVVLLSPAGASFDQFRDFEARGDRFRELVEGL